MPEFVTPIAEAIDVAAGRRPADWVLKNARIVNVLSHELLDGDVALVGDRIAGVGRYEGRQTLDLGGRILCPGFIDAHLHIESSMLSVPEFARVVATHGTTAVIADPHEFANVMGTEGISYVLRNAKHVPVDIYVMLSSCVPASPLETAGAELTAEDLQPFLANKWVLGLAEMMNYPGVIHRDAEVLSKLGACAGKVIDGHAPSVRGRELTAYAAAGIMSDHECVGPQEALEKLRLGLHVMIREGSQTRNLEALAPLVKPHNAGRFLFCTDDKDVRDLLDEGQIDFMIRKAVALGMDPMLAVRLATINSATYFGLRQTGAICPGYRADLTVLDNLTGCRVTDVFRRGRPIVRDGKYVGDDLPNKEHAPLRSSVNIRPVSPKDLVIPADGAAAPRIHVFHVLDNRIDTERSIETATVRDGQLVADPAKDLAKMVVIERHRASGEIGRGFVRGFRLKSGAIASTVAHDAHNLSVVGMNDADMLKAVERIVELKGGLVVVDGGKVLAEVPLPIAGLVSDRKAEVAAEQLRTLARAIRGLGCPLEQPFMALSFLSLSVIGKLKLTNLGLIDVERFAAIPLTAA